MTTSPRPKRRPSTAPKPSAPADSDASASMEPDVAAFFASLDHPRRQELLRLRELILGVSPRIREGIKWNAPSFRTSDFFATMNIHRKDALRLILHAGAKPKAGAKPADQVEDPSGILERLAADRCMVTIRDAADFDAKAPALRKVLRQWIDLI